MKVSDCTRTLHWGEEDLFTGETESVTTAIQFLTLPVGVLRGTSLLLSLSLSNKLGVQG